MNNDLISREALKEVLKECAYSNDGVNTWIMKNEVLGIIDNTPTVAPDKIQAIMSDYLVYRCEPQRPQGEWKRHDEWRNGEYIGGFYHVNCPCEGGYYSKWETNFCPNCGLPMKKGGADNE